MQIGILGPLEVRAGDGPRQIAGTRLRALLIRLAMDAGRTVGTAALSDAVWGDAPPADETNALQSLVSRLRRALGEPTLVAQVAGGYRLTVERDDVDVHRFERLASQGSAALRSGDATRAAATLREALALWRGPALADVDGDGWAATYGTRLAELRLAATLDRIAADSALGRAADAVPELEALHREHPLHEQLAGQLMTALCAAGRPADALAVYETVRKRLADQLGADPSADLQAVHLAVLRGELEPTRRTTRRTNLRAPLTSFVGRDDEVARIGKALAEARLVTLVGPGGAGKTRLAAEAMAHHVDDVPDGVWFVELASVTDGADVPQTVLGSLGLRETYLLERRGQLTARDATGRLLDALADKRAVLILDNCEHLIDAAAQLADQLLAACPGLRIVATSREPLGITGESLIAVAPLGLPPADAPPSAALEYPAVRLFADRATAVRADFTVDETTAGPVLEIVRRLDGLPLAIELAAARLRSLPVEEVAARLSDRFRLLTGGSRTALPRHRTLRAVVAWSWDLLTPAERLLAERLAVFPAGATLDAAEAICADGAIPTTDVLDTLTSLVDKSLLQEAPGTRYRMLETLREYGVERLGERGELEAVRAAHARFYAELTAEAEPHLRGAGQLPWMRRLDADRDNVVAALRFYGDTGDAQRALEIAARIGWYWMVSGSHAEAAVWTDYALRAPGEADDGLRLLAESLQTINAAAGNEPAHVEDAERRLAGLSALLDRLDDADVHQYPVLALMRPVMAFFAGDTERANRLADQAIALGDPWVSATVRMFRANIAENESDLPRMRADIELAYAAFSELGERWGLASCMQVLGQLATLDGDLPAASVYYAEAMRLIRELGSHDDEAWLHLRLADLHAREGDLVAAREAVGRAREVSETSGARRESIFSAVILAEIAWHSGEHAEARRLRDEALDRLEHMPPSHPLQGHGLAMTLATAAKLDVADGDLDTARQRVQRAFETALGTRDMPVVAAVGVVSALYAEATGSPVLAAERLGAAAQTRGIEDSTQPDVAGLTQRLRAALGDDGFAAAYERGRGLSRDDALAVLTP